MKISSLFAALILAGLLGLASGALAIAQAGEAVAAVATNFAQPAKVLAVKFQEETGHSVKLSFGSTGKLYAQIVRGAPFDLFMAADQVRPKLLEESGDAVAGSRFTYAEGLLVLVGAPKDGPSFRMAIANPALAPYGLAAKQSMEHVGEWEKLQPHLVFGENIGQAYAMFATGNVDRAFIAYSQYLEHLERDPTVPAVKIPRANHGPINQDAVLLKHGADNQAARAFLAFLQRPDTKERIRQFGYRVP